MVWHPHPPANKLRASIKNPLKWVKNLISPTVKCAQKNYLDIVAKLRFRGQESYFLINIEPFADNRGQFGRRMFRYFSRLFEKHALPVYPILLLFITILRHAPGG